MRSQLGSTGQFDLFSHSMLCFASATHHGSAVSSERCCLRPRLAAMNGSHQSVLSAEACQAFLDPDHTSIRVNWPVQAGSMTNICSRERGTTLVPLCCAREAVKALCELSLEATQALQVQPVVIRKGWLSEHNTDIILHPAQGTLSFICSARTCEVYEQSEGSTSYVCTMRGKPSEGLFQHDISLPSAPKAVLRLLSLQQSGSISFHNMQLLPSSPNAKQQRPSSDTEAGPPDNAQKQLQSSQKTQVTAMLQSMMASGWTPSHR